MLTNIQKQLKNGFIILVNYKKLKQLILFNIESKFSKNNNNNNIDIEIIIIIFF
jgi:hypothetical protein